jgi:hypothetical protein
MNSARTNLNTGVPSGRPAVGPDTPAYYHSRLEKPTGLIGIGMLEKDIRILGTRFAIVYTGESCESVRFGA